MKNTRKKNISEQNAPMASYAISNNAGDMDATGRGSMISPPIDFGGAAMAQARTPIGGMQAPMQPMASEDEGEEMEETEEMEEGEEEVEATPTSMPYETTEEVKREFRGALVSLLGEDVDASLISQLEAIFEAAVTDRVEKSVSIIAENMDSNVKTYLNDVTESLVEKVDDYLDYVVEEWMTENAVAVEQGVKTQIAENFISGLKNLFENHYIDVPAEKYNVLDELYASNRELEAKLNEAVKHNMDLKKEVSLTECAGIFVAETRDLADTQVAKLQNLMENVNFGSPDEYRQKLVAIRENYLYNKVPARVTEPEQTFAPVKQTPSTLVESYVGALGRIHKKL
jgi:hypothetical protein